MAPYERTKGIGYCALFADKYRGIVSDRKIMADKVYPPTCHVATCVAIKYCVFTPLLVRVTRLIQTPHLPEPQC